MVSSGKPLFLWTMSVTISAATGPIWPTPNVWPEYIGWKNTRFSRSIGHDLPPAALPKNWRFHTVSRQSHLS